MGPPKMQLDTSKLPIPDIIVAGGALLALIFSFLHWYKVEIFGFGIGASGRGGYQNWPMIIYLLLLIFAGFFTANAMANFVDINIPLGLIYLVWAAAGTFFTLLAFVIRPGDWDYVKMNWAIWIIMIIISVIPIMGGFMKVQQSK
jgi:multidrug transporter EmrE-like cation transporter